MAEFRETLIVAIAFGDAAWINSFGFWFVFIKQRRQQEDGQNE